MATDYMYLLKITDVAGNLIEDCTIYGDDDVRSITYDKDGIYIEVDLVPATIIIVKTGYISKNYTFTSSAGGTVVTILEKEPTIQSEIDRIKLAKSNIITNVNANIGGGYRTYKSYYRKYR